MCSHVVVSSNLSLLLCNACLWIAEEWIRQRIANAQRRKAEQRRYKCPACATEWIRTETLMDHMQKCCQDLLQDEDPTQMDVDSIDEFLQRANAKQTELQNLGLYYEFEEPKRLGWEAKRSSKEVAMLMGLPHERTRKLLVRALRAIPLVVDHDPLDVVYEDEALLAVNKPPFVTTSPRHRWQGGTMVNRALGYLGYEPNVVHRLDMNTTGVLAVAKSATAAAHIQRQFKVKSLKKSYLAVALGVPPAEHFIVEAPIARDPSERVPRMIDESGRGAITEFRVLDCNPDVHLDVPSAQDGWYARLKGWTVPRSGVALLLCRPKTGRTHQIRVHLAHVGHPIVGDELYGLQGPWIGRQALHALSMGLKRPTDDSSLLLEAPVPEDMLQAIEELGLRCLQIPQSTPCTQSALQCEATS
ncbi:unnamed protein product [Ostreobium quekettii]|uniref:Pseudouridine synthase RsuA/RluA-like domain-containing protein n=1 Tax=Ostreobium quekettii TaxID=121088 RepID=A0A8S1JBR6_9CHLO|nr:unnamed protein product [Ostreobium quekettii]